MNRPIKDLHGAITTPSDLKTIKEKNQKVLWYLIRLGNLRDGFSGTRIFQQKNVNLSKMAKILKMDERTIKKYWEELEDADIIQYMGKEDEDAPFNTRWKIRKINKDAYYEIPRAGVYRKLPPETLKELNEIICIDELTLKIYNILLTYQEVAILNNHDKKFFTYQDLRELLDYKKEAKTDKRLESSLLRLQSLGLIDIDKTFYYNSYRAKLPSFILHSVGFYVDYNIKDYKTVGCAIDEKDKADILAQEKPLNKKLNNLLSQFTFSGARNSVLQLIEKGYSQELIAFCIEEKTVFLINQYAERNHKNGLGFLFYNDCEVLKTAQVDYKDVINAREHQEYSEYCRTSYGHWISFEEWKKQEDERKKKIEEGLI